MSRFRYTDAMLAFLREHYPVMEVADLALAFNAEFGTDKSRTAIHSALSANGICAGRKGPLKGKRMMFNDRQVVFIREMYPQLSRAELTEAFNAQFGTEIRVSQMVSFMKNHGIKSGRTGHYEQGHRPWCEGTKGLLRRNETSYKKGRVPANRRDLGDERICSKDGYVLIKVAEANPHTGAPTRFRHKHVVIWEAEHGAVPAGSVVSFIDGDKLNCDISNLELLSRAELAYLNCHGIKGLPDELRPVMRTVAKLQIAVARRGREVACVK